MNTNTSMYTSKNRNNNEPNKGTVILVRFPPLRDPAMPLGTRIEPGTNMPNTNSRGPMTPKKGYATMF